MSLGRILRTGKKKQTPLTSIEIRNLTLPITKGIILYHFPYHVSHLSPQEYPHVTARVRVDQKFLLVVHAYGLLFMEVGVMLTLKGTGDSEVVSRSGSQPEFQFKNRQQVFREFPVDRKFVHGNTTVISILYGFCLLLNKIITGSWIMSIIVFQTDVLHSLLH